LLRSRSIDSRPEAQDDPSAMAIHPTALIDKRAEIDPSVEIGAYVIVDGPVRIGPQTRVYAHAYLTGATQIGAGCQIHPFAVIGHVPQDIGYGGTETYCTIGDGTIIREGVTIHRGTEEGSTTIVGKHCFLMAHSHVAHNCVVGDNVVLANAVLLGGHVHVGVGSFLGGSANAHQFVRIGERVMAQGLAKMSMDVPPYFMVADLNRCVGVNIVGMRRTGLSSAERTEIRDAYRLLYRSGMTFRKAVDQLATIVKTEPGRRLVAFLQSESRRGFCGGIRRTLPPTTGETE
jgi:UDP-N-acetylglucosamine acyltransferase